MLKEIMYNLIINILFLAKKIIELEIYFKPYNTLELLIIYNTIVIVVLINYTGVIEYIKA